MNPQIILFIIAGYFLLLLVIARITGRNSDNATFYSGNKKSPWFVVAFGMIGASLSGVTFISVPGWVGSTQFSYMQMVLGYMAGYLVIAWILMPVYYRLNVITIYDYLDQRFGVRSYKTGAAFFLLSRTIGASFRLFLVAGVFHEFVFRSMGVPFAITVLITIIMIWVYTFRGGIKTIVWTDTLQTFFMLVALILTIVLIGRELNLSPLEIAGTVQQSPFSKIFSFSGNSHFLIQFVNGAFIAVVMTGLDQDMMQKNLSIHSLKKAQKNIYWQMGMFIVINILFLSLGALLYIYSLHQYENLAGDAGALNVSGFPNDALNYLSEYAGLATFKKFPSDNIFPLIALKYLNPVVGATFMIGLVAAAYSSADSALTSLTTTFCADFLGIKKGNEKIKTRYIVHLLFSLLLLITILIFNQIGNRAIIDRVFIAAGYTYGPLLGLFSFGLLTKRPLLDMWVPVICILAPVISYLIKINEGLFFSHYTIGHELLIVNGMLTFFGLWLISRKSEPLQN